MRKIFLTLAAMICLSSFTFAAVGDKVYFVNEAGATNLYVGEANGWTWKAGGAPTEEGWSYNEKAVYSYTITSAECTRVYITCTENGETWVNHSDDTYTAGCYYVIETNSTNYWLTKKYYSEFYFLDNNDTKFDAVPAIALYNSSDWTAMNGTWGEQTMTSVGTISTGAGDVAAYKYAYLTAEAVANVQFIKSTETDTRISDIAVDADASKKFYAWNGWKSLDQTANKFTISGATEITGANWTTDEEANRMGWDSELSMYSTVRNNLYIATPGDYTYTVLYGFNGADCWNYRYPLSHAEKQYNLTLNIPAAGIYSIKYTYNPVSDELSASATAVYSREVTSGKFGTICLPRASVSWTGATFYKIAGKENDGMNVSVVLEEVTNNWLEAGRPYIFQATNDWLTVWFNNEDAVAAPITTETNGLVGSFVEAELNSDGSDYVLYNNTLRPAGDNVKVGAFRAYVKLENVPDMSPVPAPGRRYVRMNVNGYNAPTGVENVQSDDAQCTKILRDGQLIIVRDGVEYNAMGVRQ